MDYSWFLRFNLWLISHLLNKECYILYIRHQYRLLEHLLCSTSLMKLLNLISIDQFSIAYKRKDFGLDPSISLKIKVSKYSRWLIRVNPFFIPSDQDSAFILLLPLLALASDQCLKPTCLRTLTIKLSHSKKVCLEVILTPFQVLFW